MRSKQIFRLAVVAFLTLGAIAPAHGEGLRLRRPTLTPQQKERAIAKIQKLQAKGAPFKTTSSPDPRFQGWWQEVTRGDLFGFGFGAQTDDIDSYIFIDLTTSPFITISTLCGTPALPRVCTNLDVGSGIVYNFYYSPDSTSLVSIFDLNGPAFDPTFGQSFWSLKLQADGQTLCASSDSQPQFEGYQVESSLFQKVDAPLAPVRPFDDTDSAFPDVTDPVAMAEYIYNALLLNHNQPQNVHFKDTDYRSFYERQATFAKMLDEGLTFETPIRKIRVTRPGNHDRQEFDVPDSGFFFTSEDRLTDIFTDGFAYALAGSTVEIKGFEGKWKKLNGTYVNGVAVGEEGGIPNPSHETVDASSTYHPQKGTFRDVYNHFLLNFDSSDKKNFPRDEQGWAKEVEGHPVVKVKHRFTSDMQYPAFYAAIRAMFFNFYRLSQHNAHVGYFKPGSMFLIDSWQDLKKQVAADDFWGSSLFPGDNLIRTRTPQAVPSGFYNNPVFAERGVTTYNDPFGLSQLPGSKSDYNIVLANYIVQPKNLYWAIAGTPTGPTQFDPTIVGYLPVIPGAQPAEFVGTLGDINVVDGKAQPLNPDPAHFTLYSSISNPSDLERNSNGYYVGLIDPKLTHGKKVGYLRWMDEDGTDPFGYMATATFPPNVPVTVKFGREAYCQVISNFTRYLQTDLDCDACILDVRTNNGGFEFAEYNLAEFFGDDRASRHALWSKKDNGNSLPINLADSSQFTFFNDITELDAESFGTFFVRQNEANYGPGVVFRGSADRPKKVIVLTDNASASGGDIFPHFFLGENLDGNLGSFTTCKIIGDIDGRLKGAGSAENPVPVSLNSNFLYDSSGMPFPPIRFRADFATGEDLNGLTNIFYNQQADQVAPSRAPSLQGTAGGNPLPNDWQETVWPDIGLMNPPKDHFSKHIHKGKPRFDDRRSWRDSWLEQAIREAIKD